MFEDINPDEFDVLLFNRKNITDVTSKGKVAAQKLHSNYTQKPKSIIVELNVYRKYLPDLIKYFVLITKVNEAAVKANDRLFAQGSENHYKRWTPEEDTMLIEEVCKGDSSLNEISIVFGRSPAAISNRITTLVGVKRLSQAVAGRFIGTINGKETSADVSEVVYRKNSLA